MGTHRVFLVSLLFLASSFAQQQESYVVEGVVVDSLTGKPLPRALVQIGGHAALSGPKGQFSFDGLSPGGITAIANKPGYFGGLGSSESSSVNTQVGPDIGKIVLKLTPEAIITGRVIGRDEEPVEGVNIQALAFRSINGIRRQLVTARAAVTDEDGNFRLAGLPAGRYYLVALAGNTSRNVLGMRTSRSAQSYPPVFYYPGTTDLAAAAAVDLAPGQRMETDFSLSLLPAYRIAGTVVAAGEWKQVSPPRIMDALGQSLFSVDRYDPQSGAFEFRSIPAGSYTMLLSGTDAQNVSQVSERLVTIANDITNLKLSFVVGANIPVVVRSEFGQPRRGLSCSTGLPNGQVQRSDCSDYPAAQVTLISANSVFRQFTTPYGPVPDPSAFRIQGVAAGKYVVRAQTTLGGYVQSVRCGTQDLMQEELTVAEGGSVMPIEVVVRDDQATLKVVVNGGQPARQATVIALRDGGLPSASNPVTIFGSGTLSMMLAPGTYKVFAFDSLESNDLVDPEVLAKYGSQAASVTVAANENGSVIVDVIHIGE